MGILGFDDLTMGRWSLEGDPESILLVLVMVSVVNVCFHTLFAVACRYNAVPGALQLARGNSWHLKSSTIKSGPSSPLPHLHLITLTLTWRDSDRRAENEMRDAYPQLTLVLARSSCHDKPGSNHGATTFPSGW